MWPPSGCLAWVWRELGLSPQATQAPTAAGVVLPSDAPEKTAEVDVGRLGGQIHEAIGNKSGKPLAVEVSNYRTASHRIAADITSRRE